MNIIEVDKRNVSQKGFFCYMSKKRSEGYRRKLSWLEQRFDEGLKIKMLDLEQGARGFIEYIPGEFAWRAVNAQGYMFIHCLWVVGQSRGKGYGRLLLNDCIKEAGKLGMRGVAVLASERPWLADKQFFVRHGFQPVDRFGPFTLAAIRFGGFAWPSLPTDFNERPGRYGRCLSIMRSDQCPYVEAAVKIAIAAAQKLGIEAEVLELRSSEDVRRLSPSPYGVFGLVYGGRLVSYHNLVESELLKSLIPP
jgi:GNAT superfamily N-acetyltransferase